MGMQELQEKAHLLIKKVDGTSSHVRRIDSEE